MLCETKQQIYQLFIDLNDPNLCKYPDQVEKFLLKIYIQLLYSIENKIELEFSLEALEIFKLLQDDPLYQEPHLLTTQETSASSLSSIKICY